MRPPRRRPTWSAGCSAPRPPNTLWVADITYVPTAEGFLYLAAVIDVCTRRCVGWAMRTTLATEIVTAALDMAILRQRPAAGLIHHSDQGSQYTSFVFGARCRDARIVPSIGTVGDAYDHAVAESFFATLECELLHQERFSTREEARIKVFDVIEAGYNPRRRPAAFPVQRLDVPTCRAAAGSTGHEPHRRASECACRCLTQIPDLVTIVELHSTGR